MPFRSHDNLVSLLILAVLGFVAYFAFQRLREQQKAVDCLSRLAAGTGGTCPVSGQAYPADGPRRCPAPGTHLPTDPRIDGVRVTQTFPAAAGAVDLLPIPGITRWARLEAGSPGVAVTIAPRAWWRWGAGLLLVLAGLLGLLVLAAYLAIELGRKPKLWVMLATYAVAMALVGTLTWQVAASAWGREVWTADRAARTVTYRRFVAGVELGSPRVHAGVRLLAPVAGAKTALMLVGADGRPVRLFPVSPEAVGRLAPFAAALFP